MGREAGKFREARPGIMLVGGERMRITILKTVVLGAILAALPTLCMADQNHGSCLVSTSARPGYQPKYIWCPDGWKLSEENSESRVTEIATCKATHTTKSWHPNAKGGETWFVNDTCRIVH